MLGGLSLLPVPPVILVSFFVNIIGIVQSNTPQTRPLRWRPILGLVLTALGATFWWSFIGGQH